MANAEIDLPEMQCRCLSCNFAGLRVMKIKSKLDLRDAIER